MEPIEIASAMSKKERSFLVYVETCAVDNGNLLEGIRMNKDDIDAAKALKESGLVQHFERIPSSVINTFSWPYTYYCTLSDLGWEVAGVLRRMRSQQTCNNRNRVEHALQELGKL